MARARSARGGVFTPRAEGIRYGVLNSKTIRTLASERNLRRLVSALLLVFFLFLLAGTLGHFVNGRQAALDDAGERLTLVADTVAARVHARAGERIDDWRETLARSLPAKATAAGSTVLLVDAQGRVRARAPRESGETGMPLLRLLGEEQPLTTFGERAGVMTHTLTSGEEVLATVRNIGGARFRVAVLRPTERALAAWRSSAAVDTTLSLTTGLLLLLIGAAFRSQAERTARIDADAATFRQNVETAFAEAGTALWDWNVARGVIRWSGAMPGLLGAAAEGEPLTFREVAKALHPDDDLLARVESAVRENVSGLDTVVRIRDAEEDWIPLRLRGAFRREAETGELHLVAVAEAGPDSAAAERDADAPLHDAIESISEAFVLWDGDNRLVLSNGKYREFHNLPEEAAAPGTPYEEVIASATEPVVRARVTVADDAESGDRTYEAQLEDGRWLHIDERRTKDNGYVSVGTDITSLKLSQQSQLESEKELKATITDLRNSRRELEQQKQQLLDLAEKYGQEKNRAEAANKAKSEFLANISHELRTPLNAVIGFSEVMQNALFGPLGDPKYGEYARDIHESGNYLLEVINDILDMSKIEAGRISLDVEELDAGEIVEDSLGTVAASGAEQGITLKRTGLATLPMRADRRALKQILLNLLSNAVKFTPAEGKITVRLTRASGQARIAIADTGVGIPPSKLDKLGRPFEQVQNQLTKNHKGSGLGLAISRSLVEMHGGTFEIKSTPDKGTTVVCLLPLTPAQPEQTPAQQQPSEAA